MINTLLGFLLLLAPFLLIFCFASRWRGFLYILSFTTIWHLSLALISQTLHIFSYQLIFYLNFFAAIISIIILVKKTNKNSFKFKINYFTIIAFLIIFFELWSVHYFYTGSVSTITGQENQIRASNPYPYFSDEWVGVSIVNHTIENKNLPRGNPLVAENKYNNFSNILIGFFSLVSEIILLLSLTPLLAYPIMALGSGVLICFLTYVLLRTNGLNTVSATLGTLCVPLIVNGSNLPGLWYFLPFSGGLIFYLLSLSSLSLMDWKLFLINSLLSVLLYPPLIILVLATFIGSLINEQVTKIKLRYGLIAILGLISIATLIIIFQKTDPVSLITLIKSTIFYPSLDPGIASYPIWLVIPLLILPFSLFGLYLLYKKKSFFLLSPIIVSLIFWIIYSQSLNFFIISYERTVVACSLLLIISAAFSWDYLLNKFKNKKYSKEAYIGLQIVIICYFSVVAWSYTNNRHWEKFVLNTKGLAVKQSFMPNPPASNYLNDNDLEMFKNIKNKQFLSTPWKALVVGVASNNYPLDSKPSFITNKFVSYSSFLFADCKKKTSLAKKYKLDYIYSSPFNCDKFVKINESQEGLYLYQFKR